MICTTCSSSERPDAVALVADCSFGFGGEGAASLVAEVLTVLDSLTEVEAVSELAPLVWSLGWGCSSLSISTEEPLTVPFSSSICSLLSFSPAISAADRFAGDADRGGGERTQASEGVFCKREPSGAAEEPRRSPAGAPGLLVLSKLRPAYASLGELPPLTVLSQEAPSDSATGSKTSSRRCGGM